MAVDLEAIRRRVQELSGQRKNSSVQLWKPGPGEYKVRGIPWKSTPDGMPLLERRFYYLGSQPRILAPSANQPDPINDLIRKLFKSGVPEDREIAKKLFAKMVAYMAIIVRGEESKDVQVWSFNKFIYQRLLGFFTDEEVGDFLNPLEGFDLKVTIKPSGKKFNGKDMMDTIIDPARKSTKLSEDTAQARKWLDGTPNIDDMYPPKSVDEIKQALDSWLATPTSGDTSADEGTGRGEKGHDALDKLVNEVKSEVKSSVPEAKAEPKAAVPKKAEKTKKVDIDDDDAAPGAQNLDDAFADLMKDSE